MHTCKLHFAVFVSLAICHTFLLLHVEIQDPYWGSSSSQAHGVPGWCSVSRHHEGPRHLLDVSSRVPRERNQGAGKAGSVREIGVVSDSLTFCFILIILLLLFFPGCWQSNWLSMYGACGIVLFSLVDFNFIFVFNLFITLILVHIPYHYFSGCCYTCCYRWKYNACVW